MTSQLSQHFFKAPPFGFGWFGSRVTISKRVIYLPSTNGDLVRLLMITLRLFLGSAPVFTPFGRFSIPAALVPPLAGAVHHESFSHVGTYRWARGSKRTWKFHRWNLRHRTERQSAPFPIPFSTTHTVWFVLRFSFHLRIAPVSD